MSDREVCEHFVLASKPCGQCGQMTEQRAREIVANMCESSPDSRCCATPETDAAWSFLAGVEEGRSQGLAQGRKEDVQNWIAINDQNGALLLELDQWRSIAEQRSADSLRWQTMAEKWEAVAASLAGALGDSDSSLEAVGKDAFEWSECVEAQRAENAEALAAYRAMVEEGEKQG